MSKQEFKDNVIKDSNKFVRIDFFDNSFSKNILEATNRVLSEIIHRKEDESLYDIVKKDIEDNGLDNLKNRIVYATYLTNCLDKAVYPYVLNHFTLEKSSNVLEYLNSNVKIIFEDEQTIKNNNNETCYIDLTTKNIFIV